MTFGKFEMKIIAKLYIYLLPFAFYSKSIYGKKMGKVNQFKYINGQNYECFFVCFQIQSSTMSFTFS